MSWIFMDDVYLLSVIKPAIFIYTRNSSTVEGIGVNVLHNNNPNHIIRISFAFLNKRFGTI